MNQTTQLPQTSAVALPSVTTGPLPGSAKLYVPGVLYPDLLVPMRQIAVHPSAGEPPVTVYDPSGAYTDPAIATNIAQGLASLRATWVTARGDCEAYAPRAVQPTAPHTPAVSTTRRVSGIVNAPPRPTLPQKC